jgi:hypothetical protein
MTTKQITPSNVKTVQFLRVTKDLSYNDGNIVIPQGTIVEVEHMRNDGSVIVNHSSGYDKPFEIDSDSNYEHVEFFTRWGDRVELVSNHGEVQVKGHPVPFTLLSVQRCDDKVLTSYFADTLRCQQGGSATTFAAIRYLPIRFLPGAEKKAAIKKAL